MRLASLFACLCLTAPLFSQNYPPPASPQQQTQDDPNAGPPDEPGRAVARLGILSGDGSIRRGDSTDWQAAAVNAPLMSGDRLSTTAGSRAEIQFDVAHFLRVAGDTEVRLSDMENGHYQVQLAHGLITWRLIRNSQAQAEIETPLVAVHPGPLSEVRLEVSGDGSTSITVRRGEAQVSTQKGSEKVTANSTMMVRGNMDDPEFQVIAANTRDEWDNWSTQRDNYLSRAQSPRYVTEEVSGVEDLDAYGHWEYDPSYGWVWQPTVASSWAPYRDGQWVWEDYYGWTWVDYEPWGWAPFHYGTWYNRVGYGWAWFPGPRIGHAWWRPAMVSFFGWGSGGIGIGFGFGNVGWIPLAPYERFHPWYGRGGIATRASFGAVGSFRNAGVSGGITAVSANDFQRGNFRNTIPVDRGTLQQASLMRGSVPLAPTSQNLRFSNRTPVAQVGAQRAEPQHFYGARNTSAPQRTPFTQQQSAVRSGITDRFRSTPPSANPGQSSPAPGFNRFGGVPLAPHESQMRPYQPPPQQAQPRQYQVSPSIIQRPAPSSPPQQMRQAPSPVQGQQRSAPPASSSRQSGNAGHQGRR